MIARFVEVFYNGDGALLAALADGGPGAPDVAPISVSDLPANNGPPGSTGPNSARLAGRYSLHLTFQWGIAYTPYNFTSTAGITKWLVRQLYIRQALQLLVDQPELIETAADGYGIPVYGPVPVLPPSSFAAKQESSNPYPPDPAKAKQLLQAHGWTISPDAADVCIRPGTAADDCGRGIPKGAPLRFTLLYAEDEVWKVQLAVAEAAAWAGVGIEVTPQGESLPAVLGTLAPCAGARDCSWTMANFGGWYFVPDYMPTGDYLFAAGAADNYGNYDDAEANRLISASERSNNLGALYRYETYLAKQLPVLWQPDHYVVTFEVAKHLGGVGEISPLTTITPEYWYWTTAGGA